MFLRVLSKSRTASSSLFLPRHSSSLRCCFATTTTAAAPVVKPPTTTTTTTTTTTSTTNNNNTTKKSTSRTYVSSTSSWYVSSTTSSFARPRPPTQKFTTQFNLPLHSDEEPMVKIVATIGPTSEQETPLLAVTTAGMNIMRLNFSHATKEEVELRIANLQKAAKTLPDGDTYGVLLDTKGPEIRTGKLANDTSGKETVELVQGNKITLYTKQDDDKGSTAERLFIDYPNLAKALRSGNQVLLDDGACILLVNSTDITEGTVDCTIQNTASLRSRAGVNLPLADTTDLPALSEKDKADILYGMSPEVNVDYIAASFVQSPQGVLDIRQHIEDCAQQLGYKPDQPRPLIISKIETASALKQFDDILEYSDAIMVARGDLGVEIPLSQVTNAQKEMVAACNAAGKPCIVATQMLESMTKNPRPTRAEVADVTNAVYDGADCVMLSGETAKGNYPAETVSLMQTVLASAEHYALNQSALGNVLASSHNTVHPFLERPNTVDGAVAAAAATAASERSRQIAAVVVLNAQAPSRENFGTNLATLVAAYRPLSTPILACCATSKIARQLQLYRGIRPMIVVTDDDGDEKPANNVSKILEQAKKLNLVQSGKEVIILSNDDDNAEHEASMKITKVP